MTIVPDPPYLISNKPLRIVCIAEGRPIPTVQWYKINTIALDDPSSEVSILVISGYSEDCVMYTCVATNNAGNKQHVIQKHITIDLAWYIALYV